MPPKSYFRFGISPQCIQTFSGANKYQSAVTCLQLNSCFVITSSDDGTVKLWDVKSAEFIRNIVSLESGGAGGIVWKIRTSYTELVCAVGSRNGTYNTLEMEFDLIGAHCALANAFRRIMLSEVPSMAIEQVFIYNNTSILQDEVLAHRLGLIPLKADPRLFEYKSDDSAAGTEHDTLEFELKVKCSRRKDIKDSSSFDTIYKNHKIYSDQIKWVRQGKQTQLYSEADVGPIHDDILLSKMRPGHEFDLKLLAVKGLGKDHAKFSPVSTAYYRLMPDIKLNRIVSGKEAFLLQKCFSPGVVGIDDNDCAYVKDARYDSCCRNVYHYPQLSDAVTLARIRDHFIFTVESVGALKPDVIFIEAVKVLKKKCQKFMGEIDVI